MPRPITLAGFAGANLAVNPRLLAESVGVNVVDADPGHGDLRPLHAATQVATVPTSSQRLTIYRLGRDVPNDANYWLQWTTVVNATRGFDATDPTERTYFTGSGTPKWTDNSIGLGGGAPYPQATRELAVPAPLTAATLVLNTDGTGTQSTRFYVHTFVNDLGWESAPSPLSTGLTCKDGAIVDISSLPAAPGGNYGITARRIYRTQTGTTGATTYFFLREITIGTTSTQDDARRLGDAIATIGWIPPAVDAFGLIGLWNGMFALCTGKTIAFSPPHVPYAYPVKFDIIAQDTPVATAKYGQNFLVLTTGAPVLITGQDPESMSDQRLAMVHPCASARSVVGFGHGVAWASNEGLAYAGDEGQSLVTGVTAGAPQGLFTTAQWKALVPSSMIAGRYGRFYVCSYNDGSGQKGFMIDPLNPAGGVWFLSFGWDACHYDELADVLYILQGGNVKKFDAGSALTATFKSKSFLQTAPVNYAWAKVEASGYPITLKVYADGALKLTKTVANRNAFSLPSGFLATEWQVEVNASVDVQAVRLATHVRDLKSA